MQKYLVQVGYTPDGLKSLMKDKAAGRVAAVKKAAASVGGKLESLYWTLGKDDAIAILDLPDVESATALAITLSASGLARSRTTRLLTGDEVDAALKKTVEYQVSGKK
jgi:uncharacterized protein with GYD domain